MVLRSAACVAELKSPEPMERSQQPLQLQAGVKDGEKSLKTPTRWHVHQGLDYYKRGRKRGSKGGKLSGRRFQPQSVTVELCCTFSPGAPLLEVFPWRLQGDGARMRPARPFHVGHSQLKLLSSRTGPRPTQEPNDGQSPAAL